LEATLLEVELQSELHVTRIGNSLRLQVHAR
jgi:hypothetical protein